MTTYRRYCPKHPQFDEMTAADNCGLCGSKLKREKVADDYYDNY